MVARSRHSSRRQILIGPNSRTMRGAAALQDLLTEFALVLLPRGVTPKWFGELARSAFVRAAADISRLRNGRVNHSRVAAQTGLTRADVKRLLKQKEFEASKRGLTAVEKVVEGWRADAEFLSRPGQSKRLRISGRRGSFAHLVRKYGGDVTHRAVLDELRRVGAVHESGGTVELRRSFHLRQGNNFAFLSPVIPLLIDGLRLASKRNSSNQSSIQRLELPAETDIDLAIVRERCASSAQSMLEGLAHSLRVRDVAARRRSPARSITVTVLVAENALTKGKRKGK